MSERCGESHPKGRAAVCGIWNLGDTDAIDDMGESCRRHEQAPGGVRGEARRPGPAGPHGRRSRGATPSPRSGADLIRRRIRRRPPCALDTPAGRRRAGRRLRIAPIVRIPPARSVRASGPGTEPPRRPPGGAGACGCFGPPCGGRGPRGRRHPVLRGARAGADHRPHLVHDHDGGGYHKGNHQGVLFTERSIRVAMARWAPTPSFDIGMDQLPGADGGPCT